MFESGETALFSIIALCVPLFGAIIYFGLKDRKQSTEQWMKETNARLVLSRMSTSQLNVRSLLYGNFYDSSPSAVTLMIKDRSDKEVAKTVYEIANTTIEADKEKYLVFNEMKPGFHITVRPMKTQGPLSDSQIAECVSDGMLSKRFQYNFANVGKLEVQYKNFGKQANILKDGIVIGEWFRLGSYELSGSALVLSVDMPLIVQIILLSGPFRKRQAVPY